MESILHEAIKQGLNPSAIATSETALSVANLGACGVTKLCYNFCRVTTGRATDLELEWSDGSHALAFDIVAFAAFEIHILRQRRADRYDATTVERARTRFDAMSAADREHLSKTVTAGMPGRMVEALTLDEFRDALNAYSRIDGPAMRRNLAHFLREVVPAAEAAGVYLAIHPDDPPMPLLGLPRVVSTADDVDFLLKSYDSPNNGITFCVGSYGSNKANRVEEMAQRFASRTHFVHLRNVRRTDGDGSFVESDHLDGEVDMLQVVRTFTREAAAAAVGATRTRSCPSGPTTATRCSTTSTTRRSGPIPATRRSGGCAGSPSSGA